MRQTKKKLLMIALAALTLASCGTAKKYVMLNDLEAPSEVPAPPRHDLRIKKGDPLQVHIGHHDPVVLNLFNQVATMASKETEKAANAYVVNSEGYVHLPIFDSLYVEGLTCNEVATLLTQRLEEEGIAYGATVSVRISGFKVTIIGETVSGVFEFEDNGATVLDLMARANMAGATGEQTRRDRILVMRERDSIWETAYISLLSTDLFNSPYFYLEQNDVYYLYPTKSRIWRSNQSFDFWWNRISLITSLGSLVGTYLVYVRLIKGN